MAHSKVYFDGNYYVTLVAHVVFVNELIDPEDKEPIIGLLEYSLNDMDGSLRVYDPDDDRMYDVKRPEDWEGLDKEAVKDLLDAADGGDVTSAGDPSYRRIRNKYLSDRDPLGALEGHKVGTVVRLSYGEESGDDVLIKREDGLWEAAGSVFPWTEDEVETEDYEVIYRA